MPKWDDDMCDTCSSDNSGTSYFDYYGQGCAKSVPKRDHIGLAIYAVLAKVRTGTHRNGTALRAFPATPTTKTRHTGMGPSA